MEGDALEQSCVSPKTVKMNFQFRKEEKVENELGVVSMEGDALAQSCVSMKKTTIQKLKECYPIF